MYFLKQLKRGVFFHLLSFRSSKGTNKYTLLISDSVNTSMMKHLRLKLEVRVEEPLYSMKALLHCGQTEEINISFIGGVLVLSITFVKIKTLPYKLQLC